MFYADLAKFFLPWITKWTYKKDKQKEFIEHKVFTHGKIRKISSNHNFYQLKYEKLFNCNIGIVI